jgi:outer membrane protein
VSFFRSVVLATAIPSAAFVASTTVSAETIFGALSKAYQNNSTLNSTRAGVRVTDESVAIARSGWRPTISGSAKIDYSNTRGESSTRLTTGNFGVQIDQPLFDGFQTRNNVAQAEAQVRAAMEGLNTQQNTTLFEAARAYVNVIHDRQIARLREQDLKFLTEQVRTERSRLDVGEGTRTSVAQAEARQATARAQLSAAQAQVLASAAVYRQIIGVQPGKLKAPAPLVKLLPSNIENVIAAAGSENPAILADQHRVDASGFGVKATEGALLPTLSAKAGISQKYRGASPGSDDGSDGSSTSTSIGATLTVPVYSGGRTSAQIRQQKEKLGRARIDVDVTRDQVGSTVVAAWTAYQAGRETVEANHASIAAAQLALTGVIEERDVGQKTTLDVLNAQNVVISAQIKLATSERDVVISSYSIMRAMGRLTVDHLGLRVRKHEPKEHYKAVKDKWTGSETADDR